MRNFQKTYNRLTEIIIDLLSVYGYKGISIRMITKKANIKESTFYHYFKNKKSIYDKIFKLINEIVYNLKIIKNNNGYLFLQNSIINFLRIFNAPQNIKLWRILNIESFTNDHAIRNQILSIKKNIKNYISQIILDLKENNLIKSSDINILIDDFYNNIISMINEFIELKFNEKDSTQIEEKIYKYIKYFWEKNKNF